MLKLREYQKEPVRKAIEYFREDNTEPVLMVFPTAWGKSLVAAEVAAACPDPILVVQPSKELLEQNLEKYRLLCGALAPAGVYSASFGKKQIDHVTFATIGSIKALGAKFRELGFRKMLIDEAHLYPRKEESMLGQFLKDSGIRQVLGITATPLKLEQFTEKQGEHFDKWSELIMLTNPSPSGSFFKRIIHASQIQEMVSSGFWSTLLYETVPYDRSLLRLNSTGSEYSNESIVGAYVANGVRENIFAALRWHKERRHVLVFVPSVEEAAVIAEQCPDAAMLCGETPKKERQDIIARFRRGELRTIVNVNIVATGFDHPGIDMIIMAAPTASVARYYQIAGRGVRIEPGKKDCLVVDMAGNCERFGKVEDIAFAYNGRWRMYGSGGRLLSGIPVDCIGSVWYKDIKETYSKQLPQFIGFGKHAGKAFRDVPLSYLRWCVKHTDYETTRYAAIHALETHVRDTRGEMPITVMPDGKHAGIAIGLIPRGYLLWYYKTKEWNEYNDSLRRGIEMYIMPKAV